MHNDSLKVSYHNFSSHPKRQVLLQTLLCSWQHLDTFLTEETKTKTSLSSVQSYYSNYFAFFTNARASHRLVGWTGDFRTGNCQGSQRINWCKCAAFGNSTSANVNSMQFQYGNLKLFCPHSHPLTFSATKSNVPPRSSIQAITVKYKAQLFKGWI